MRLLFSSSDIVEIGRIGREFLEAGILCGIRYDPPREGACPAPAHAELWVQSESDFYQAVVLYLRLAGSSGVRMPERLPGHYPTRAFGPPPAESSLIQQSRPPAST